MNTLFKILSFLSGVFSGKTGDIMVGILDIAKEVVKEYQFQPLDGKAKRKLAFETIQERANNSGIKIEDPGDINLAIELAAAELRK